MNVVESIAINADRKTIFSYLVEVKNRKDYIPALDEVIMLDPLPIRRGSRYIEVAVIAGRKLKTTYQVTTFVENEKMIARTLKSIFPIEASLSLTEETTSTRLTIQLKFTLKGIFKLASGIVQGIVSQQARDILDRIKRNIETVI